MSAARTMSYTPDSSRRSESVAHGTSRHSRVAEDVVDRENVRTVKIEGNAMPKQTEEEARATVGENEWGGRLNQVSLLENPDEAARTGDVYRTVLLLGKTGNGKSTIANVLLGTHWNEPPEDVFKEGDSSRSVTTSTQEYIKELEGRKYRIVDTIGIGDTGLREEKVLLQLARGCHYLRGGINQIFFVTTGRFTKEEREAYEILRCLLFDDRMSHYLTIVRAHSTFFLNDQKCEEDIREIKNNEHARDIYERAAHIIHVNNPNKEESPSDWVEFRKCSRTKLLARLERCNALYVPSNIEKYVKEIEQHVEEGDRLRAEIKKLLKENDEQEQLHNIRIAELDKELSDPKEEGEKANKQRIMEVKENLRKAKKKRSRDAARLADQLKFLQRKLDGADGKSVEEFSETVRKVAMVAAPALLLAATIPGAGRAASVSLAALAGVFTIRKAWRDL